MTTEPTTQQLIEEAIKVERDKFLSFLKRGVLIYDGVGNIVNFGSSNTSQAGDIVSNCCAWEWDGFGIEKDSGIWQERCLKCGNLCEPLWMNENDIKSIKGLAKLEKRNQLQKEQ